METYNGINALTAIPTNATSVILVDSVLDALQGIFTSVTISQSLNVYQHGTTYTLTYGENDGDIPDLVCNVDSLMSISQSTCTARTVMDGNTISGHFYLGASNSIPFDATAGKMKEIIENIAGINQVEVFRTSGDKQGRYSWMITIHGNVGDVLLFQVSSSLFGKEVSVSVMEVIKGNQLGGSYQFSYKNVESINIPYDANCTTIKVAIEGINGLDDVAVTSKEVSTDESSKQYLVTFLDVGIGDADLLLATIDSLNGVGAIVTVKEEIKGSEARGDTLHASFSMPRGCSESQVPLMSCGNPVKRILLEISKDIQFSKKIAEKYLIPDFLSNIYNLDQCRSLKKIIKNLQSVVSSLLSTTE